MGQIRWYETRTEIAQFAIPLLKQFQTNRVGYPGKLFEQSNDHVTANSQWGNILADMESAMQTIVDDEVLSDAEEKQLQRKLELFGKWFYHLWD